MGKGIFALAFIGALFTIAKQWKQLKWPWVNVVYTYWVDQDTKQELVRHVEGKGEKN